MTEIQKATKIDRFINRTLGSSIALECWNCRWSGERKDTLRDIQPTPDANVVARIETTQKTQIDLYCPECGHFIITYCEDD
jgi:hypothetical protein